MTTAVLAVVLLLVALAAHRSLGRLDALPSGSLTRPPSVAVVVPARNEALTLPTLLASLSALTTSPAEVVVVDDGSHDETASIARAAAAAVCTVEGPPAGWTGKAWACHVGAGATDSGLLLFLDADTELAPHALADLLAVHARHGGLVSVQPFHAVRRAYEQLSSYFNAVSALASGAFGRHPERRPMAFGPCLLTSRVDYLRAGGHAAVRGEVLDDVQLAAAYHRAGLPVHCFTGAAAMRMRMYPGGPRQLVEGWTKNFASGASAAAPGPTAVAVLWLAAHHAVAVGTVLALVGLALGHPFALATGAPGLWLLAWVVVAAQLRALLRRLGAFRWWTWALFPLPLLAFDVVFARSVLLTAIRRTVRWRGRDVDLRRRTPEGA